MHIISQNLNFHGIDSPYFKCMQSYYTSSIVTIAAAYNMSAANDYSAHKITVKMVDHLSTLSIPVTRDGTAVGWLLVILGKRFGSPRLLLWGVCSKVVRMP